MIYNDVMAVKKSIKSEQLMFRASKQLAQSIRRAAAQHRRSVADWLRQTVEAALTDPEPSNLRSNENASWNEQVSRLAEEGWLAKGTQKKTPLLLEPPLGPGPSGVLEELLKERREGR